MHTMVTENRQQRKFKPVWCDFDGDAVLLPRYRNPVYRLSQCVTCYKLFWRVALPSCPRKQTTISCPCDIRLRSPPNGLQQTYGECHLHDNL
ncbi:hypothetical protein AVEN_270708-1 [Araneus ventricosus]|uniref:Uncharacterized protein n=1 Tax=Araneus ventricosus TaxID=182803 RepID=A0A4Y2FIW4_ARAVE|nr:hypothetical protein AVEN_270708-1 [Araneus ventricosus]